MSNEKIESTKKTVKILSWVVFLLSIANILKQIVFIIGILLVLTDSPENTVSLLMIGYIIFSLAISIWMFILGNRGRKDELKNISKTQKHFIIQIALTILLVIIEIVVFDDTLPYIPILLVPFLIKGLVDVKKVTPKIEE